MDEERRFVEFYVEGTKLFGILHLPVCKGEKSKPYPVVAISHGLGGHKLGRNNRYVALAKRLAQQGIAVLRFDFRGCGDSMGEFCESTIESEVADLSKALDYLSTIPDLNSSAIGLLGSSFGGLVAMIAAGRLPSIKALVLWAPLFDGKPWLAEWQAAFAAEGDKKGLATKDQLFYVQGRGLKHEFFRQLFALHGADELQKLTNVPLLHIQGEMDETVGLMHADSYAKVRAHAKASSSFIRLAHSDHEFSHKGEFEQAMAETLRWFGTHLFSGR